MAVVPGARMGQGRHSGAGEERVLQLRAEWPGEACRRRGRFHKHLKEVRERARDSFRATR